MIRIFLCLRLKHKFYPVRRHPSVILELLRSRSWKSVVDKSNELDHKEVFKFISELKAHLSAPEEADISKLNRLCYLEDWEFGETLEALSAIGKLDTRGLVHRKDWEWARGIIAMKRFDKLKKDSWQ